MTMRLRTDSFHEFTVGERSILRDESGYLAEPDDWDENVARLIAEEEHIELTDDHWAIISFMRDQQAEHGVSPDARHAFSFLAERKAVNKRKARNLFFELFPYGYVKQACKIAGMVQPRAWSTG
ncbi:MAG: TusE/DsrC/DsvC family sulfur relay protein [Hyphomicrobiaceae bacterium]|nr:TusE/DsrC/DsvC family sulfur relay protein [Hyphomicrobiaceae bacterium]